MAVGEISVTPVGTGVDMTKQVQAAVDAIGKRGLSCKPTAMGTNVEGSVDDIFAAAKDAYQACLASGAKRCLLDLRLDHRSDKSLSLDAMESAIQH